MLRSGALGGVLFVICSVVVRSRAFARHDEGLPDADDRHVLAAASKARGQVIVTVNLKDFPAAALERWSTEAKHPDEFVLDQIDLDQSRVYAAIQQIADSSTSMAGLTQDQCHVA